MREGWNYKRLIEVCDFQGGSQPPKEEWSKEPKPNYVRMLQIRDFTQSATDYIEFVKVSKSLKYCQDDDILLGRYGASVGKVLTGLSGAYNVAIIKAIPNVALVSKKYIKSYFLSPGFQLNLGKVSQHRAAQAGFSKDDIAGFPIPIPPIAEQEKIVAELDCLTSIIDKKKQQLEELDKLAQSIFYDMFGDPITNEKGWKVKLLNDVCSHITDGDHMPPPKAEIGIPFITISNIDKVSRRIVFDDTFFVPQEYYDNLKDERKAKEGDLLYTVTGSYGIPVVVSGNVPFCFQRHIALIRPQQKEIRTVFLCYWALCKSVKQMADTVATGIAQKTVGLNSIRRFPIIIPEQSIQDAFAKKIEAIEKQKELVKQSIVETEMLLGSRMDNWFN